MLKRILVLLSFVLISQTLSGNALAEIMNFNITGTYGRNTNTAFTLFSEGDSFSIRGSFDTTIQPLMETKSSPPNVVFSNWAWTSDPYYSYGTYSAIVSLTQNIPMGQINSSYPSDGNSRNDGDFRNGKYFMSASANFPYPIDNSGFYLADNYTELSVSKTKAGGEEGMSGFINFNYHVDYIPQGEFTVEQPDWDEITLNITQFNVSAVPAPASVLLLGGGLAGLAGLKRKLSR